MTLLPLLAGASLLAALTPDAPQTGTATYYAPGIMERVYAYRLDAGDVQPCPACVGFVALLDKHHIGRKVWIQPPDGEPVGPLLVIDCAAAHHRARLLARGWVADLSYELGQRFHMRGPLPGITVHFRPPHPPRTAPSCARRSDDPALCPT